MVPTKLDCYIKPVAYVLKRFASLIGLYHPLDGITNPMYKLLHFWTTKNFFCEEKKAVAWTGKGAAIYCSVYGWFSSI